MLYRLTLLQFAEFPRYQWLVQPILEGGPTPDASLPFGIAFAD
jgi:hypothetical protein